MGSGLRSGLRGVSGFGQGLRRRRVWRSGAPEEEGLEKWGHVRPSNRPSAFQATVEQRSTPTDKNPQARAHTQPTCLPRAPVLRPGCTCCGLGARAAAWVHVLQPRALQGCSPAHLQAAAPRTCRLPNPNSNFNPNRTSWSHPTEVQVTPAWLSTAQADVGLHAGTESPLPSGGSDSGAQLAEMRRLLGATARMLTAEQARSGVLELAASVPRRPAAPTSPMVEAAVEAAAVAAPGAVEAAAAAAAAEVVEAADVLAAVAPPPFCIASLCRQIEAEVEAEAEAEAERQAEAEAEGQREFEQLSAVGSAAAAEAAALLRFVIRGNEEATAKVASSQSVCQSVVSK